MAGIAGTALTIDLEMHREDNGEHLSDRTLCACILLIAGFCFDTARQSTPSKDSLKSATTMNASSKQKHSTTRAESLSFNPSIEMTESPSKSGTSEKNMSIAEHDSDASVVITGDTVTAERIEMPAYQRTCCAFAQRLLPFLLLMQSLALFLETAREESVNAQILPFTTLSGLIMGYLFSLCIKNCNQCGLSRFLENHRYEFIFSEYAIYIQTILISRFSLLFAVTTGSFWTGYNFEQLTNKALTKFLKRPIASRDHYAVNELIAIKQASVFRLPIALLTSAVGIVLLSCSFVVLKQTASNSDETLVRNCSTLWLASVGNYALLYPLGTYIGRFCPYRYYRQILTVATYLLVPFASPNLTIVHYVLLAGAGLSGGVANFISCDQYQRQLTKIKQQKQRTDALQRDTRWLFELLPQLRLSNDLLLQQHQQKKRNMGLLIKGSIILLATYYLYLFFAEVSKQPSTAPQISGLFIWNFLSLAVVYIAGFHLLPRWAPSVYATTPLSRPEQFFYRNSFTLPFLAKICVTLTNMRYLSKQGDNSSFINSDLFGDEFFYLVMVPSLTKLLFKRVHGYLPYIPSSQDIEELESALQPEALRQRIVTGNARLSCSYHLLRFMQENRAECLLKSPRLTDNPIIPETRASQHEINSQDCDQQSNDNVAVVEAGNSSNPIEPCATSSIVSEWRPMNVAPRGVSSSELISSVPVAALYSGNSHQAQVTLEAEFDRPYDRAYTQERLDNTLIFQVGDATVRGATVARQFTFGLLPEGLRLSSNITSFRL